MTTWAWNDESDSEGVGHYAEANTDYSNAAEIQQAYDYVNFSEITPNPVACWPLHEDSGSTAYDVAGTNDGTIKGATVGQTGVLGTTAYSFDGTDDSVDPPNNILAFDGTTDFSITAWVKIPSTTDATTSGAIFSPRSDGAVLFYATGSVGGADPNYAPFFDVYDGSHQVVFEDVNLSGAGWQFLAATWDVSSGMAFYRNGVQKDTNTFTGTPAARSADDAIGQRGDGTHYLNGLLADVRIYNSVLTSTEVQTNYDVVATKGDWLGTGKTL